MPLFMAAREYLIKLSSSKRERTIQLCIAPLELMAPSVCLSVRPSVCLSAYMLDQSAG